MAAKFYHTYIPAHSCADPRNACEASDDPDQNLCFESLVELDYLHSPAPWA